MFLKPHPKTALIWKGTEISYTSLIGMVQRYSQLFSAPEESRIAIFSENRPEWIYSFYAAWKNGCVPVPVDAMSVASEVAYILNDCTPEVILCSSEKLAVLNEALKGVSHAIKVIVFEDIPQGQSIDSSAGFPEMAADKTAVILYTSGTTGSPKGVMLSYDNLLVNINAVSNEVKYYSSEERVMMLLPFHHVFPLLGTILAPLFVGATCAFAPAVSSEAIIDTLQRYQITLVIGVPRLYNLIRKGIREKINKSIAARTLFFIAGLIKSKAFSKLIFGEVHRKFGGHIKYLICGGAALDPAISRDFRALGFDLYEGYGMTESAPMITFPKDRKNTRIGSPGQELFPGSIKIIDGEITAKGRNIMKGYYNRPEETTAVLRDGRLYTGDLGYLDKDGYLYITGRKKEIIVLPNGKNINPEELEAAFVNSTGVIAEAGVFIKDGVLQAVILPDMKKLHEKYIANMEDFFRWEVIDKYNQNCTPYKKIMKFSLVNTELPRTRLGKLQRFMLPAFAESNRNERAIKEEPVYEEYAIIKKFLSAYSEKKIHPDDHIEIDLSLDSLDKVKLQVFIENSFGVKLTEKDFTHNATVEKLSEFVKERKVKMEEYEINWSEMLRKDGGEDIDLPRSAFYHTILKDMAWMWFKIYFTVRQEGVKDLPEGPFIFAPNHQSFFDGLFVTMFLKSRIMKNTYFFAKGKHFSKSWRKFLAQRNNIIVMGEKIGIKDSLVKMAAVLRKNKNIIIFPEGTRTRTGEIGKFKQSFAILAKELNVPIVPVVINGAYEALPKGSIIARPFRRIKIKYLPPVFPEDLSYEDIANAVHNRIVENFK